MWHVVNPFNCKRQLTEKNEGCLPLMYMYEYARQKGIVGVGTGSCC